MTDEARRALVLVIALAGVIAFGIASALAVIATVTSARACVALSPGETTIVDGKPTYTPAGNAKVGACKVAAVDSKVISTLGAALATAIAGYLGITIVSGSSSAFFAAVGSDSRLIIFTYLALAVFLSVILGSLIAYIVVSQHLAGLGYARTVPPYLDNLATTAVGFIVGSFAVLFAK